jgi:hypothetical protein
MEDCSGSQRFRDRVLIVEPWSSGAVLNVRVRAVTRVVALKRSGLAGGRFVSVQRRRRPAAASSSPTVVVSFLFLLLERQVLNHPDGLARMSSMLKSKNRSLKRSPSRQLAASFTYEGPGRGTWTSASIPALSPRPEIPSPLSQFLVRWTPRMTRCQGRVARSTNAQV